MLFVVNGQNVKVAILKAWHKMYLQTSQIEDTVGLDTFDQTVSRIYVSALNPFKERIYFVVFVSCFCMVSSILG